MTPDLSEALQQLLGSKRFSTRPLDLSVYSTDLWPKGQIWKMQGKHDKFLGDAVVWPEDVAQIQEISRLCSVHNTALIPFGGGSGVCGGTLPIRGGVQMDVKRLNSILEIDTVGHTVRVQSGVIGEQLQRTLEQVGMTLGHFPSSIYCSTVGGWAATRSAGQYSSRYGKIEDMILSLRFVDGTGTLWDTADHDPSLGGVDLTQLWVGSEGILGTVVDLTLKIHPLPESTLFHAFEINDIRSGIDFIRCLSQADHQPLVLRMYDPLDTLVSGLHKVGSTRNIDKIPIPFRATLQKLGQKLGARVKETAHDVEAALHAFGLAHPALPNRLARLLRESCLFIVGFDGSGDETRAAVNFAKQEAAVREAKDLGPAPGIAWLESRHKLAFRQADVFRKGAFIDTMEVATTYDNLERLYTNVSQALAPLAVTMAHFSHAYRSGCSIYFTFGAREPDPILLEEHYNRVWRIALSAAGSQNAIMTHHHGVGLAKRDRMRHEIGAGIDLIRAAKKVLDPHGIMNPGKVVP
jgi:alkyldihydroxyacetonephosphate synthase